ncbi:MAG: GTP-binding protein [Rhodospirillaceae bacterium]|nr:GTP-binding protein [Rhodospirillaceae bacterium]
MTNEQPSNDSDVPLAVPVSLLTGFLGSGKTTVLNKILSSPNMEETAVLINEYGDISIDHLLVEKIDENVVLLEGGCVCCSVRGDLSTAMRDLLVRRADGTIPPFRRLIIETTGLADPAPVIHTLITDPVAAGRYRLDGIITTVDGVLGWGTLDQFDESLKQVAVADRIIITKTDIADKQYITNLKKRLSALNPGATHITPTNGEINISDLFDAGLFDSDTTPHPQKWLSIDAVKNAEHSRNNNNGHGHKHGKDSDIYAFSITSDKPIKWEAFTEWLDMLLTTQGDKILRMKGVLDIEGQEKPIAVHGVQHVFYPPQQLDKWADGARLSQMVMITKNLGEKIIRETFDRFVIQQK